MRGKSEWMGGMELLNIVMIGLTRELPEKNAENELHRLLAALLSNLLTVEEKLNIINSEYDMGKEECLKEEVKSMCNLSQGIYEEGIADGEDRGGIKADIRAGIEYGIDRERVIERVCRLYSLKKEEAEKIYDAYVGAVV